MCIFGSYYNIYPQKQNYKTTINYYLNEKIKKLCYDLGGHAFYLSGAGSTLMAIVEKENGVFSSCLKTGLEEIGCGNYNLLKLCVDNDGVKLYEETEDNSKE